MTLEATFKELGLTPNDTRVYLSLLELGEATGYGVSQKTGMPKPTVYFTLEELRKKGLAHKIPKGSKHVYAPKDPSQLLAEAHRRIIDIETVLPYLMSLKGSDKTSNVVFYEGAQGILDIHTHLEHHVHKQEVLTFYTYHEERVPTEVLNHVKQHHQTLRENKTRLKIIAPYHDIIRSFFEKTYKNYGWDMRYLPMEYYNAKISVQTCGNRTWIISRHKEQGFMIENEDIARFVENMFTMLWNFSPPIQKPEV